MTRSHPFYINDDIKAHASPGLQFGMFFEQKIGSHVNSIVIKDDHLARQEALADRQRTVVTKLGSASVLSIVGVSQAPFSTGLGNEHPSENGFAFLNPHGLPYLAGSGVKGVLRQAAAELCSGAWGESSCWQRVTSTGIAALDLLFGPNLTALEGDEEQAQKGLLSFWDVYPQCTKLSVDTMTPHLSGYYQNGEAPHDAGQPKPIFFLVVPAGSKFGFSVVCNLELLELIAPDLAAESLWRKLLEEAFAHAFDWLGFGAKTSVGYGAMKLDPEVAKAQQAQRALELEREEEQRRAKLSPDDLALEDARHQLKSFRLAFEAARLTGPFKPGGEFAELRREFTDNALLWPSQPLKSDAAALLAETATNTWGKPSKKAEKRFKADLRALAGEGD